MPRPGRAAIVLAFAALYLIWGSTYLGIRFAIETIPPFLMAGSRFFLAGLIIYSVARLRGEPRPAPATWRASFIVGACLIFCGNGGVTFSQQFIASGLASVMVATVPIHMTLLGWLSRTAPRPRPIVWLGLAGGFAGVFVLVAPALRGTGGPQQNLGLILLLFSSFLWSAGSIYSRTASNPPSPFLAAGQQMLCGGALLVLASLVTGEAARVDLASVSLLSFGAYVYLVVIGSLVGFTAYIWLLRHCEPSAVATYAYVNPVVAIALGAFFAGETLSPRTGLAAALIIGSVALVISLQRKPPVAPPAECSRGGGMRMEDGE